MTSKYKPYRTKKQREIMSLVIKSLREGAFFSMKELHAKMTDNRSYGALRKAVKGLEAGGMVCLIPEGNSKVIAPTERGLDWFRLI